MPNVSEPSSVNSLHEAAIIVHATGDVANEESLASSSALIHAWKPTPSPNQFSKTSIMSTELRAEPALRDPKICTMPSTMSKQGSGEATSSLDTEKSLTPVKLPKAETYHPSTTTEAPARETFLMKSFRKLGSMLRLSVIGKSFRSKSYLAHVASKASDGWADIVDHVIESDSDSESFDSYLDFMHARGKERKGHFNGSARTLRLVRKRGTEERYEEGKEDEGNGNGIARVTPWFDVSS